MAEKIETWLCEVCGTEYKSELAARRCEASPIPPCPVKIDEEIKLQNRNRKTYTMTKVTGIFLANHYKGIGMDAEATLVSEHFERLYPLHDWVAEVDPPVYLDHHWEDRSSEIALSTYLVPESKAKEMTRKDNDCEG